MIDMIERLRGLPPAARCPHGLIEKACKDCEIAAQDAEIERLTSQVKELNLALADNDLYVQTWSADYDQLVTENATLAEANAALRSELASARALLAQYEQAPVVGWWYEAFDINGDAWPACVTSQKSEAKYHERHGELIRRPEPTK